MDNFDIPKPESHKRYIGDSVYVDKWAFGGIVLTTNNGYENSNEIFLEPEVIQGLITFLLDKEIIKLKKD